MIDHYFGLTEREKTFLMRWSRIRKSGKLRYIVTRGLGFGLMLYGIWFAITILEISSSEFERAVYFDNIQNLVKKCAIWFVCYMTYGFIVSVTLWKKKEEKYEHLSPDESVGGS